MSAAIPSKTDLLGRISTDQSICHGKPCIRGLRYPVETILELLSSSMTTSDVLAECEDLEPEDVLAALARIKSHKLAASGREILFQVRARDRRRS